MKYLPVFLIGCSVSLLWPASTEPDQPTDAVAEAFDTYERLFRETQIVAAEKLDAGEFTTEPQVHEFIETAQPVARQQAFAALAEIEGEALNDGEWTPEKHAALLRGFAGE